MSDSLRPNEPQHTRLPCAQLSSPEQTCTQINGHWLCWGRIEGITLICIYHVFQDPSSQRPNQWLLDLNTGSGMHTKWRIVTGFRRPPWPHAPLFLTLILVLVIDGKQYPTHVQDRIQAKIQNDSYADLRNSFSNSLLYYNVVWKLMLPVPLGAVSVSLCPRITELCLRSGKSLLTKRSPLVPFPFHNNCRPLLLDAQCLIADISWILDSFLIAYDEKLSSNMVVLWWEEESSVFKHWHVF